MKRTLFAFALGIALCGAAMAAPAPRYSFQTIDTPYIQVGVDGETQGVSINDSGMLTVQYQKPLDWTDFLANQHTAIVEKGRWMSIDVPGAALTSAGGASSSGWVPVSYTISYPNDVDWKWALYRDGEFLFLPDPPGNNYLVSTMNSSGSFSASGMDGTALFGNLTDPFILKDEEGGIVFSAGAMNNAGLAVGQAVDLWTMLAYGYVFDTQTNTLKTFQAPGSLGLVTGAIGINNRGDIVGFYYDGINPSRGFLLRNGVFTNVDYPGALGTIPYSINDRGQIAGIYYDTNWVGRGFLADPVPGK